MKRWYVISILLVLSLTAGCRALAPDDQQVIPTSVPSAGATLPPATAVPLPTDSPPTATSLPVVEPSATLEPTATSEPTAMPEPTATSEPTALPTSLPTPTTIPVIPVTSINKVGIGWIQMIDSTDGWAIGGNRRPYHRVLRTRDGGETWLDMTPNGAITSMSKNRIAADFTTEKQGWTLFHVPSAAPTSGSLVTWYTADGGNKWKKSTPLAVDFISVVGYEPFIQFTSGTTGWIMLRGGAGGASNYPVYLLQTSDSGTTWTIKVDPTGGPIQSCNKSGMSFSGASNGWVSFNQCPIDGAQISKTSDGGATWAEIALPAPSSDPTLFTHATCSSYDPHLFSASAGVVRMSCAENADGKLSHYLYRTSDGGTSWTTSVLPGASTHPGYNIHFLNSDIGFAFSNRIYRTLNGGSSWSHRNTVIWWGKFSFINRSEGWGVVTTGPGSALVHTVDGASSFEKMLPLHAD